MDIQDITGDNIDYYNFLESNCNLAMYIKNLKNNYIYWLGTYASGIPS